MQGVTELRTAIVKLVDGYGKKMVKIAFVIPGGEIYYLDDKVNNLKPAQQWARAQILKKLEQVDREQADRKLRQSE